MIYITGSGPGDYGLLTIRAREVIERADVVIYDRLIGESILALIPEGAELIDAGKSSGSHTLTQQEIISLIIDRARKGLNVVRLKGGDPFLFGRGAEEAEAIISAGLEFEVIPGVSSALSVPEYSGIPATHRDYCSGINIYTAHDKNNLIPDFNNTTSIFLMGVSNSEALQAKLLNTYSHDTPCAVIENGTTSLQRTIRTSLEDLHESICRNNITPPAVIVVGETAGLNLDWRNNFKLSGKRIIITRPSGRSGKLAELLRDKGAEVILLPTIKTSTIHNSLDGINLNGYDWIGFTSVTGVNSFFELLCESGRDIREIGGAEIAAIGPATGDALRSHGLKVNYIPEVYDGYNLAEGLSKFGGRVLMLRALNGTKDITETFRKYGISFNEICIYRTDYVKLNYVPKFTDIIIFTSASTVRGFVMNSDNMREVKAVCIGHHTAHEAEASGFTNIRIAEQATVMSIYEAVMSCT